MAFLFLQHLFGVSHHCCLLISMLILGCLLLLKYAKTHSSGRSTLTNLKHLQLSAVIATTWAQWQGAMVLYPLAKSRQMSPASQSTFPTTKQPLALHSKECSSQAGSSTISTSLSQVCLLLQGMIDYSCQKSPGNLLTPQLR